MKGFCATILILDAQTHHHSGTNRIKPSPMDFLCIL